MDVKRGEQVRFSQGYIVYRDIVSRAIDMDKKKDSY